MPRKTILTIATAAGLIALGQPLLSDEDDVFAFIPDGGRTLLERLREHGLPDPVSAAILQGGQDPASWAELLAAEQGEAEMDTWQIDTLAHYLAANAPLEPGGDLPADGRDMTLTLCQSCHIVTVVVTQSRTREAWLGTIHKPSHIEIEMTEGQREALADYLVINGGIPIDLVPPALRAGGASY